MCVCVCVCVCVLGGARLRKLNIVENPSIGYIIAIIGSWTLNH